MQRPSDDDLLLAAEWLDSNEGDKDESEPMKRVAEWLRSTVADGELRRLASCQVGKGISRRAPEVRGKASALACR